MLHSDTRSVYVFIDEVKNGTKQAACAQHTVGSIALLCPLMMSECTHNAKHDIEGKLFNSIGYELNGSSKIEQACT